MQKIRSRTYLWGVIGALALSTLLALNPASADEAPTIKVDLPVTTQAPLWPPSVITNQEGDFVLLGVGLFTANGFPGFPFFDQKLVISKDSRPPMDPFGNPIRNNWFLAPYDIVRPLDLRAGSPDLDMVLYNLSIGPPEDGSNVARIPAAGDSAYNLLTAEYPCPDTWPSPEQKANFSLPRFPLHQFPIQGFQGDGVGYDVVTGEVYDPMASAGPGCGRGCSGEDLLDFRPRSEPITLGDWIQAKAKIFITLTDWSDEAGGYTAAILDFRFRNMIPGGVYTVWTVRNRQPPGSELIARADPIGIPNIIVANDKGRARVKIKSTNPFPDPATDFLGERVTGVIVDFHLDYQTWGACGARYGPGVETVTHLSSFIKGNTDFTPFVTVPPVAP
ncbi:MAG: hypothetical protein AAF604_11820 [Acidobacteriota bacterium]